MNKNNIYILLISLLLMSCSDESIMNEISNQAIRFSIGFPDKINTRATTNDIFETSFEEGDEIGIFIYKRSDTQESSTENNELYINNEKMTYHAGSWQLDSLIYYPDDESVLDIYAYYPYQAAATVEELKYDALVEMNDLLTASALGMNKDVKTIPLKFEHLLSLVHISIEKTENIPNFDETFSAYFHGIASGKYNLATKTINNPEEGYVKMTLIEIGRAHV